MKPTKFSVRVEHQITLEDESVVTMRGIVQVEDGIPGPPIFEGAERVTQDGDEFDYVPSQAEMLEFQDFASKDVEIRAKQAEFRPEIILTERGRALFGAWVLANSIHCGRWRHGESKLTYCSDALSSFLAERIRLFCAGHASDRGVFAAGIERALSVAATSGFPNEFAAMPLKGKLDFLLGLAKALLEVQSCGGRIVMGDQWTINEIPSPDETVLFRIHPDFDPDGHGIWPGFWDGEGYRLADATLIPDAAVLGWMHLDRATEILGR